MTVKLRERKLKSGRISLYLDYYRKGKRWTESLNIVLTGDKTQDKELRAVGSAARAQREVELKNEQHGFAPTRRSSEDFLAYFEEVRQMRVVEQGSWKATRFHLLNFLGSERPRIKDITPSWLEAFQKYLVGRIAPNTALGYLHKINRVLNVAVRDGILPANPMHKIDRIKRGTPQRAFLTFEEMKLLAATACAFPEVKRAFLFSCYTGIRIGDLNDLKWEQISEGQLILTQKKTKEPLYLPLNAMAQKVLGERDDRTGRVFELPQHAQLALAVKTWVAQSGIGKNITFHSARHTFATLALTYGADH